MTHNFEWIVVFARLRQRGKLRTEVDLRPRRQLATDGVKYSMGRIRMGCRFTRRQGSPNECPDVCWHGYIRDQWLAGG